MKHRPHSEAHQGKRPRVPADSAAAAAAPPDGMEDKAPSIPRELTQNPLKKIWMPYKNGLPETHISQRKGAYDDVAAAALLAYLFERASAGTDRPLRPCCLRDRVRKRRGGVKT